MIDRPKLPEGVTPEFDGPVAICAYSSCKHYDTYEDACKLVDTMMMKDPCLPYHEWLAADHAWLEARVKALTECGEEMAKTADFNCPFCGECPCDQCGGNHMKECPARKWRELTEEEGGQR